MMKKILHIRFFAILGIVLLLIVGSCVKELVPESQSSNDKTTLSVEDARLFFEGFVTEFNMFDPNLTSSRSANEEAYTPMWKKGKSFQFENAPTVEIPLNTPYWGLFQVDSKDKVLEDHEIYKNTVVLLRARINDGNEIEYHSVRITADVEWMMKKGNHLRNLSLEKLDDFSGEIRYRNMDGTFHEGYKYKNGKKVARIFPSKEAADAWRAISSRGTMVEICEFHIHIEYMCYPDIAYDGEEAYETEVCYLQDYWEEWNCYTEEVEDGDVCPICGTVGCAGDCEQDDDDDDENTNPNDTSTHGQKVDKIIKNDKSEPHFQKEGDKYSRDDLLRFCRRQPGSTCTVASIGYNLTQDGESQSTRSMVKELENNNVVSTDIMRDGVPTEEVERVINYYYETEKCTSFTEAIDNGKNVISSYVDEIIIYEDGSIHYTYHSVTIVGYHAEGEGEGQKTTLIYMDTAQGELREMDSEQFKMDQSYILKAKK